MANLADIVVVMPVSGTWNSTFARTITQTSSASFSVVWHPSTAQTAKLGLDSNLSRTGMMIHNSGSVALLVRYGQAPTVTAFSDKLAANTTLTVLNGAFTGQVHLMWDAAATLSASSAQITEFTVA